MKYLKAFIKKYIEFTVGTIFGATVATITSYFVFAVVVGDVDVLRLLNIQACLLERIEVIDE